MSYTENDLRAVLQARSETLSPGAAPTAATLQSARHQRGGLAIIGVVAAVVATAVLVFTLRGAPGRSGQSSQIVPPAGGTVASPSTAAPIELSLVLDQTTVPSGGTIHGQVVVTNTTSKAVSLPGCVEQWLSVGLTNSQVPFTETALSKLCPPYSLQPGQTRFDVTVSASYQTFANPCGPNSGSGCVPTAPPLPPGTYTTRIYAPGLPAELRPLPRLRTDDAAQLRSVLPNPIPIVVTTN